MILELDIGNSRIKWRLLPDDRAAATIKHGTAGSADELSTQLAPLPKPALARACSVQGEAVTATVTDLIHTQFKTKLHLAQVTRSCAGVTNQYENLRSLGVDRWLAMLAAFNQTGGPCVVVDSGTALTVDVVDADGLHHGGYIVPGQAMMRGSIEAGTRIRLRGATGSGKTELGISTVDAVGNGSLAAAVALIERVALPLANQAPLNLLIAGGDGTLLQNNLTADNRLPPTCRITPAPDLVLNGLALAVPHHGAVSA